MAKDCELSCENCEGEDQYVKVYGNGWRPLYFIYCENAIFADRQAGFTVEVISKDEYEKGIQEA